MPTVYQIRMTAYNTDTLVCVCMCAQARVYTSLLTLEMDFNYIFWKFQSYIKVKNQYNKLLPILSRIVPCLCLLWHFVAQFGCLFSEDSKITTFMLNMSDV